MNLSKASNICLLVNEQLTVPGDSIGATGDAGLTLAVDEDAKFLLTEAA